jgi:hypothetical protein
LTAGHSPRATGDGHLLFVTRDGTLMSAPVPRRGVVEIENARVVLDEPLFMTPALGFANYDLSPAGPFVYAAGAAVQGRHEFVWVDREGRITEVPGAPSFEPGGTPNPGWVLSPDHRQVAYAGIKQGNSDIYVLSLDDGVVTRLTFDPALDMEPRWTPDGSGVVFYSDRTFQSREADHLWTTSSSGGGTARPLVPSVNAVEGVWTPDMEWLVLRTAMAGPGNRADILAVRPGAEDQPVPLVTTEGSSEWDVDISPDGRWLAYASDVDGRAEVFVQRLAPGGPSQRWQVSVDGGIRPLWAHNGRELFFMKKSPAPDGATAARRTLMVAEYRSGTAFEVLRREELFTVPTEMLEGARPYDVSADDEQFLMVRSRPAAAEGVQVQLRNFLEELEGRGRR